MKETIIALLKSENPEDVGLGWQIMMKQDLRTIKDVFIKAGQRHQKWNYEAKTSYKYRKITIPSFTPIAWGWHIIDQYWVILSSPIYGSSRTLELHSLNNIDIKRHVVFNPLGIKSKYLEL